MAVIGGNHWVAQSMSAKGPPRKSGRSRAARFGVPLRLAGWSGFTPPLLRARFAGSPAVTVRRR